VDHIRPLLGGAGGLVPALLTHDAHSLPVVGFLAPAVVKTSLTQPVVLVNPLRVAPAIIGECFLVPAIKAVRAIEAVILTLRTLHQDVSSTSTLEISQLSSP
jgi:hypothetical protein